MTYFMKKTIMSKTKQFSEKSSIILHFFQISLIFDLIKDNWILICLCIQSVMLCCFS